MSSYTLYCRAQQRVQQAKAEKNIPTALANARQQDLYNKIRVCMILQSAESFLVERCIHTTCIVKFPVDLPAIIIEYIHFFQIDL